MIKRLFMAVLLAGLSLAAFAVGETRYISVQSLAMKEKSSNTSKTVGTLSYGDEVTVAKVSGKWTQVSPKATPSVKGWVSSSALSKRKIVTGKSVKTDANEISLAGKGFTEGFENRDAASWDTDDPSVDSIESNSVSDEEMQAFIKEGKLREAE
ncbi:MAG: SH3 domain-containing protein [Treponema sp.]|nr:SH3 domain-containing protein [Treponema sp.]